MFWDAIGRHLSGGVLGGPWGAHGLGRVARVRHRSRVAVRRAIAVRELLQVPHAYGHGRWRRGTASLDSNTSPKNRATGEY